MGAWEKLVCGVWLGRITHGRVYEKTRGNLARGPI